jgi:GDPmannose 4,6-dehydratase
MKKVLITGITGQDGSYLAELLLEKGYEVHGLKRRLSADNNYRIVNIINDIQLHTGDLADSLSILNIIKKIEPDEIYNLAAQSHVSVSFENPEYTANVDALGPGRILESIRTLGLSSKFYQASTSEMFGLVQGEIQSETTPFYPRSPYGVSKVYAHWITKNYRESYDMFACSGILFNHESPRRGLDFVTKKIVNGIYNIHANNQEVLYLGNLDSSRDWGHAKDFVRAMWMILQNDEAKDFVVGTGNPHSIRDFVEKSGEFFGMKIEWSGSGVDEIGVDTITGKVVVKVSPKFFRPVETTTLRADYSLAKLELGWKPEFSFEQLVEDMCINETGSGVK